MDRYTFDVKFLSSFNFTVEIPQEIDVEILNRIDEVIGKEFEKFLIRNSNELTPLLGLPVTANSYIQNSTIGKRSYTQRQMAAGYLSNIGIDKINQIDIYREEYDEVNGMDIPRFITSSLDDNRRDVINKLNVQIREKRKKEIEDKVDIFK